MDDASREPAPEPRDLTAAGAMLRSLARHDVEYLFANLGTDHPPILEALGRARDRGEAADLPEVVTCPHEFPAISAAHGYAAATGRPQAVLVHVDVGTQNLGGGVHNAHRANAPVLLIAGRAPVSTAGFAGSRDNTVHYKQDVFDQPGIVRQYCRWTGEYVPPADPDATIARALERAMAPPGGPVYLSAGREALESREYAAGSRRPPRHSQPPSADATAVAGLAERIAESEQPLVITGALDDEGREALVGFAEAAGAGVVEHGPQTLSFPRDHPLHVGFDPGAQFDRADLVIVAGTDLPWVPASARPKADATVVQVDPFPSKPTYPRWDFRVDETVRGAVGPTLAAAATALDPRDAGDHERWRAVARERRERLADRVADHREAERLTPAVLSAALATVVGDDDVVVEDAVTSGGAVRGHLPLSGQQRYFAKGGSGLGWALGAAVGVKLARPERRVIAPVGDGAYLFGHPVASAWLSVAQAAPTLTVVYDNAGWNAVHSATEREHPEGRAVAQGVPESQFGPAMDLSVPATAVGAHTAVVEDLPELEPTLREAARAVDEGTPAVVDVKLEPV